jgi:t-SNARE complex subunit (syntaxin)
MMNPSQTADIEKNGPPTDDHMKRVQQQVQEVKAIMADNVVRVMERGERLEDLDARTDALHASSQNFQTSAHRVHRNMCLKNLKWTIILGIFVVLIVALIIILILNGAGVFDNN